MASERIDHAAEAERLIARASAEDALAIGQDLETAQVHATLAVAEQLRVGNLIAWTTANGAEPVESVERMIEEGLGL